MKTNNNTIALEAIWIVIKPKLDTLRKANENKDDPIAVPSDDIARQSILDCLTIRDGTWRRSKPSKGGDDGQLLWQLVKFHQGNGSLWGYPWFVNRIRRDELDTLAIVLLGCRSNAADAWQKAIYG